jgi:hypothetical protein
VESMFPPGGNRRVGMNSILEYSRPRGRNCNGGAGVLKWAQRPLVKLIVNLPYPFLVDFSSGR